MNIKSLSALFIGLAILSCQQVSTAKTSKSKENATHHVMTKEKQTQTSPDQVLKDLVDGNLRFQNGNGIDRDHQLHISKTSYGQHPKAVVLSCIDSRVPVEHVFDQGIGDIFVGRVAGNFVNEDMLGSIEYSCKVAGSKLVMVLGHQHCGAIKGAIDDVKLGNITPMLEKLKPAVQMSASFDAEKTTKNEKYVKHVSENNVRYTMNQIREKSPVLKQMEDQGEIKIVGAYYQVSTGKIEFVH